MNFLGAFWGPKPIPSTEDALREIDNGGLDDL